VIETFIDFLIKECMVSLTRDQIIAIGSDFLIEAIVKINKVADLRTDPVLEKTKQSIYRLPNGIEVLSYDHATRSPVWASVATVAIGEDQRVVKVLSRRKRTFECSDDESLAIFDTQTGELVRRRPEDSIGGLMAVVIQEPRVHPSGDFDYGWLHAALVANGWMARKSGIGYAHNSEAARVNCLSLVRNYLKKGATAKTYHDDGQSPKKFSKSIKMHITIGNGSGRVPKLVHDDIQHYGTDKSLVTARTGGSPWQLQPRKALYKTASIQDCGDYGHDTWLGFLCGYLENDGTLAVKVKESGYKQVVAAINTSSPYLAEDIKKICRILGIRYCTARKNATAQSHPGFSVILSGTDVKRMVANDNLRFYTTEANDWLEEVRDFTNSTQATDSIDIVPITCADSQALQGLLCGVETTLYSAVCKARRDNHIGRYTAARIIDEYLVPRGLEKSFQAFIKTTRTTDIHWDIVDRVTELGVQTVYCIGVPRTKLFAINNGLVLWGTIN